jgi:hypothetical protein
MLKIVVMCGGAGDGGNGQSGVEAAIVESVDVRPVVKDVGVFAVAVAMLWLISIYRLIFTYSDLSMTRL